MDRTSVTSNEAFDAHILEASTLEQEGMESDRTGDVKTACARYRAAASKFNMAVQCAPEDHPDIDTIVEHRKQVLRRASYLGRPLVGEVTPLEEHIQQVKLAHAISSSSSKVLQQAGGSKMLATAAGLGAVGGLVVLGPIVGAGIGIVAGAGAIGYAATRTDKVGNATRSAAGGTLEGARGASRFNEEHQIGSKMKTLVSGMWTKTKEVNEKHDISGKISRGAASVGSKASELNTKYNITGNAGSTVSQGLDKANSAVRKSSKSDERI